MGTPKADDGVLHDLYIDRIYDAYVNEVGFVQTDDVVGEIASSLPPRKLLHERVHVQARNACEKMIQIRLSGQLQSVECRFSFLRLQILLWVSDLPDSTGRQKKLIEN